MGCSEATHEAHVQAAQAMSAYSDWAPQQYQEEQGQPAAPAPASAEQAASCAPTSADPALEGQPPAESGNQTAGFAYDSASGALFPQPLESMSLLMSRHAMQSWAARLTFSATCVKHSTKMNLPCAGYYYDPGSGFYYDANSGLYFDSSSQQWLALDPETGQFSVPLQADSAPSTAAEASLGVLTSPFRIALLCC